MMTTSLMDMMNVLVVGLDPAGTITMFNRFAEATTGYIRDEAIGQNWFELMGPGHIPVGFRRTFEEQRTRTVNIAEIRCRSGEERVIEWRNALTYDTDGEITGMLSVGVDITDRHFAILNFASADSTFHSVFENASMAMMVGAVSTNPGARRRLTANTALLRLLGYASEELDGMGVQELVHPQDLIEERRMLHELLHGDRDSYRLEMRLRHKEGDYVWTRVTVLAVRSDPTRALMVIFVEDVTTRHRALEALDESERELRLLETRLAETQEEERQRIARELHDQVSQNLTSLSINVQLARAEIDPSSRDVCERLDSAVDLINETAGHIRDLTFELRPPMLVDEGLKASLVWHAERFERQTGLAVHVSGDEPSVRLPSSTEIALFRIAQEALINAVKHAQATKIDVTLTELDEQLQLSIQDDGTGFDVTAETGGAPSEEPRWGLVNMRARAEELGGRLDVTSSAQTGTCVVATVPR